MLIGDEFINALVEPVIPLQPLVSSIMLEPEYYDVYLSHGMTTTYVSQIIYDALKYAGFNVWWDKVNTSSGMNSKLSNHKYVTH